MQPSLIVAARVDAEQRLHLLVPQRRDVLGLDLALDQRALDLVAQDHVRRIGDLVGVDADEARLARASAGDAGCRRSNAGCVAEVLARAAARAGRRRRGCAPSCISNDRLWLSWMAIERACADRLAEPVARQVLLVARVAGLVDRAHQALHEVVLAIARRQAHVLGHAAAERMRALVEPAGRRSRSRAAPSPSRLSARCAATGNGPSRRDDRLAAPARSRTRAISPGSHCLQVAEDAVDLGAASCPARTGPSARRSGDRPVCVGEAAAPPRGRARSTSRRLARKPAQSLAGRCAAPGVLAARRGERLRLDQRGRQRVRVAPVAPDLAQVGALRRRRAAPARRARAARPGAGRCAVRCSSASISAMRRGARLVALGRHHRRPVPAGDRLQVAEAVQAGPGGGRARRRRQSSWSIEER